MTPGTGLRSNPHLYEISAWPWLDRLSRQAGRTLTLADVRDAEWARIADAGFDVVYLMGVWRRSPIGRLIARTDSTLLDAYDRALPGWAMRDVVGSPYCIQAYEPDPRMGGWDALDAAREQLSRRGVGLFLDFVPNHTGFDHEWVRSRPELYVQGSVDDLRRDPGSFHPVDDGDTLTILACGRDPHFPPWRDVAQLNWFNPATREAMAGALASIAQHCDGVRCDMAMLLLNDIFEQTWAGRVDLLWRKPDTEFWPDAIRRSSPLLFLAEVYWEREYQLQQQGFHYTYDKRLLDRLRARDGGQVRAHLRADPSFNGRLVRFLENHDEERAAAAFGAGLPAAAAAAFTLPGMRFFYDGQLDGAHVTPPVQLGRWLEDEANPETQTLYRQLFELIDSPLTHDGAWQLLDVRPSGGNDAALICSWWTLGEQRALIVSNISGDEAAGLVQLPALPGDAWLFVDHAAGDRYRRTQSDLAHGLYVRLAAGHAHLFTVEPAQ